jgi:hypothetical protein
MLDIGIVYYRIGKNKNTLNAIWYTTRLNEKAIGTGIAKGNTSKGFPDDYVWKSGFDYTDIVKCDGEFFLLSVP